MYKLPATWWLVGAVGLHFQLLWLCDWFPGLEPREGRSLGTVGGGRGRREEVPALLVTAVTRDSFSPMATLTRWQLGEWFELREKYILE